MGTTPVKEALPVEKPTFVAIATTTRHFLAELGVFILARALL
jgi:hypothetical protein